MAGNRFETAVGVKLKAWRTENNKTQGETAALCGFIQPAELGQIEVGRRRLTAQLAIKLERGTAITAEEWMRQQAEEEIAFARADLKASEVA